MTSLILLITELIDPIEKFWSLSGVIIILIFILFQFISSTSDNRYNSQTETSVLFYGIYLLKKMKCSTRFRFVLSYLTESKKCVNPSYLFQIRKKLIIFMVNFHEIRLLNKEYYTSSENKPDFTAQYWMLLG